MAHLCIERETIKKKFFENFGNTCGDKGFKVDGSEGSYFKLILEAYFDKLRLVTL
jgi:hypothetical protein